MSIFSRILIYSGRIETNLEESVGSSYLDGNPFKPALISTSSDSFVSMVDDRPYVYVFDIFLFSLISETTLDSEEVYV